LWVLQPFTKGETVKLVSVALEIGATQLFSKLLEVYALFI
jgi:hypothetical protein